MGYSEFGGGGSVKWEVDVDEGNVPNVNQKPGGNPKRYKVNSLDREGTNDTGRYFLVTIDNPNGIRVTGNSVTLRVPITNASSPQVRIEWALDASSQQLQNMKDVTPAQLG